MELNERLQKLRVKKKFSLQELADKIGVSTSTIVSWEKGSSVPSLKHLQKLSNVYNVSIDNIVGNKKEERKNRMFLTFSIIGVLAVALLAFELIYSINFYDVVGMYKIDCTLDDNTYSYEIAYNKYDLTVFESGDTYIVEEVLKNENITKSRELKDFITNYFEVNNGTCNYTPFSE